jgi:hypothetical protein
MTNILIVDKNGSIKELNVKSYQESDLYKKAGFKTADGFSLQTRWAVSLDSTNYDICLYGKTKGRAGQENKYEFPPPVDTVLYFGSCVLVNANGNLSTASWNKVYEHLYGGFEDIGDEDSEESNDDEELEDAVLTKDGYVKDGFIVDDDDSDEDFTDASSEQESSEEEVKSKKNKNKKKPIATKTKPANVVIKPEVLIKPKAKAKPTKKTEQKPVVQEIESVFDCTSELQEEEYV